MRNALVLFDSEYGNTKQVAQAVAAALRPEFSVRLVQVEDDDPAGEGKAELIFVGGPTHRRRMSRRLRGWFALQPRKALKGVGIAAFGTRYRMSAWLSGSAAKEIARRLRKLGGRPVLPPEDFFVEQDLPPEGQKRRHERERMEAGELERAAAWAVKVAEAAAEG
jgi:flavodoxin